MSISLWIKACKPPTACLHAFCIWFGRQRQALSDYEDADGNHAYIVYEGNDARPGEAHVWLDQYATMSIVNIETKQVEK